MFEPVVMVGFIRQRRMLNISVSGWQIAAAAATVGESDPEAVEFLICDCIAQTLALCCRDERSGERKLCGN